MKITEAQFRKKVLEALINHNIVAISLGSGTFDIFIDERKSRFIELKLVSTHYKPHANGFGISLAPQTKALRAMKSLPIILACDYNNADNCYIAFPKELRKLIDDREKYPNILIGIQWFKHKNLSFKESIAKIVHYFRTPRKGT